MKVYVPKTVLTEFVRKALRRYPREYGALLYGTSKGSKVRITEILAVAHLSSNCHFWYDHEKAEMDRPSGQFLGTIHSHPDTAVLETCELPSVEDWSLVIQRKEMIQGILHIRVPGKKPRTKLAFYLGYPVTLDLKQV